MLIEFGAHVSASWIRIISKNCLAGNRGYDDPGVHVRRTVVSRENDGVFVHAKAADKPVEGQKENISVLCTEFEKRKERWEDDEGGSTHIYECPSCC